MQIQPDPDMPNGIVVFRCGLDWLYQPKASGGGPESLPDTAFGRFVKMLRGSPDPAPVSATLTRGTFRLFLNRCPQV